MSFDLSRPNIRSTAVERCKTYETDRWYHVWNRGVDGADVFLDDADCRVFIGLFARYLSEQPQSDTRGRKYESMRDLVQLGTFCLVSNHFHLLLRTLRDPAAMTSFVARVKIGYAQHFRDKYGGRGPLFETRFQADRIESRRRLLTCTAYVNLNYLNDPDYRFSGHSRLVDRPPDWMNGAALLLQSIGGQAVYQSELDRMTRVRQANATRELRKLRSQVDRAARKAGCPLDDPRRRSDRSRTRP